MLTSLTGTLEHKKSQFYIAKIIKNIICKSVGFFINYSGANRGKQSESRLHQRHLVVLKLNSKMFGDCVKDE